jgi:hypothetical protein
MLGLDPSIPLSVKPVDVAGSIGQWGQLGLLKNQLAVSNATVEPTIQKAQAEANLATTSARRAAYQLPQDMADRAFQEAGPLSRDPRIVRLSAKDQNGQPLPIGEPERMAATEAINEAQDRMIAANVPRSHASLVASPLLAQLIRDPSQLPNMLANINIAGQNRQAQTGTLAPNYQGVPNQAGTTFLQTNPNAPGGASPIVASGGTLKPPNVPVNMPGTGNPGVLNPATNTVTPATVGGPATSAPSQLVPPGMTPEAHKAVIAETQSAATEAAQAGGLHGINDQIWNLTSQATTSKLGKTASTMRQWMPAWLSSSLDIDENTSQAVATDKLTKYIAQQNVRMAQSMGVHTDAQSAQVAQAGGEQHYAPEAGKSIVNTNDGFLKGQQMYAQGLNRVVNTQGSQAAAGFKMQFGNLFDADTGALLHLMESGNKARIKDFIATHGGTGSDEMNQLGEKATALRALVNGQ